MSKGTHLRSYIPLVFLFLLVVPMISHGATQQVAAGESHTVGVKSDGTVIAVGFNYYGQCDVSAWTDIVALGGGYGHTVGLKNDGTVIAVGFNFYGQCDVGTWNDIVSVAAGYRHTVGVKSDGTVLALGNNDDGQCNTMGLALIMVSIAQPKSMPWIPLLLLEE